MVPEQREIIKDRKLLFRRRAHWWLFYSRYWGYEGSQYEREGEHVGSGTCLTDSDSSFSMQVKLELPDKKDEYGYYDFVVIADVADYTGETHSAEIVQSLSTKEYFLTRPGTYHLGLATAQCCYAPAFRTTAPSKTIVVRE